MVQPTAGVSCTSGRAPASAASPRYGSAPQVLVVGVRGAVVDELVLGVEDEDFGRARGAVRGGDVL